MKRQLPMLAALIAALLTVLGMSPPISSAVPDQRAVTVAQQAGPPRIPAENVMAHLRQFQQIAEANGGTRAHGTPGYRASVEYVKNTLQAAGFEVTVQSFSYNGARGFNVIAEWPYGDPQHVIMVGAHLDSVRVGPGINDNASGSSAILEVALAVSRADLRPENRLRFAWWGAEELGLIGSDYYARNLGQQGRSKIDAYLNFDMVGQKDIRQWGVYAHNDRISSMFQEYFAAQNIDTYPIWWNGSSDHSSFTQYGITVGGIGNGNDPCYHSPCDDITNVGSWVMGHSTNAIAHVVWQLAGTAPARDFSVSVSPDSGTVDAGDAVSTTVSTATTRGDPQPVKLTAQGLPEGAQVAFEPSSVTSGESAQMTITTTESTPGGVYAVTVSGDGKTTTDSATFSLTVTGNSSCAGFESMFSGQLSSGDVAVEPNDDWFYTGNSGQHSACLDGPDGTDFDLYLQKWNGYNWVDVDHSYSSGPDEQLTYNGTAGYYRYQVHAYSGSGSYSLGYNSP